MCYTPHVPKDTGGSDFWGRITAMSTICYKASKKLTFVYHLPEARTVLGPPSFVNLVDAHKNLIGITSV